MTKNTEMTRRAAELRVPEKSTSEELECRGLKVLTFGSRILAVGYYYMGRNKPSYFGAAYEFTTGNHTCEGSISLKALSKVEGVTNEHLFKTF